MYKYNRFFRIIMKPNLNYSTSLSPPPDVYGMTELQKHKFTKQVKVPMLKIENEKLDSVVLLIKKFLLKILNFKPVTESEDQNMKLIYLNPKLVHSFSSLNEKLNQFGINEHNFSYSVIELKYENWKSNEILRAILPEDEMLSSYSLIGHIAHINLKSTLIPYKYVIGNVLLDKLPNCKTIVNKTTEINNEYRNFQMEVIAGETCLKTQCKENNCIFELDLSEVYWNPRLSSEHARICSKLKISDTLYDVFCGIGPFAIPAAKKGCYVLANDLNPASCKWLLRNKEINKISKDFSIFNEDAKDFIKIRIKNDILNKIINENYTNSTTLHVVMNLPSTAYTFLSCFIEMFTKEELDTISDNLYPVIHLYCFIKEKGKKDLAITLIEDTIKMKLSNILEVICVRDVAPKKEMIRVSFKTTYNMLLGNKSKKSLMENDNNLEIKRVKID